MELQNENITLNDYFNGSGKQIKIQVNKDYLMLNYLLLAFTPAVATN